MDDEWERPIKEDIAMVRQEMMIGEDRSRRDTWERFRSRLVKTWQFLGRGMSEEGKH